MELIPEIAAELRIAMQLLGLRAEAIESLMATPGNISGDLFRKLGADIYLACSIGSWRSGDLPAEEFLDELRSWNARGPAELEPGVSYGKPTPPDTEAR